MTTTQVEMSMRKLLSIGVLLLLLAGCNSDDDSDAVSPLSLIGEWSASHHSKNPKYADTAEMWPFTFYPDGTGTGPYATKSFRYKINGNHITLHLQNIEAYYGQTVFEYDIVSFSKDRMEWDEIPNEQWGDNSLYLKFYRK